MIYPAAAPADRRLVASVTWSAGGGAILAVSPETSTSFLLDFHYKPEDEVAGKSVLGSDETVAVFQLGLGGDHRGRVDASGRRDRHDNSSGEAPGPHRPAGRRRRRNRSAEAVKRPGAAMV